MASYVDSSSNYATISKFGRGAGGDNAIDNPLSYTMNDTLDQKFLHGTTQMTQSGQWSSHGQWFLASYGAAHFDEFCVYASMNQFAGSNVVSVIDQCTSNTFPQLVGRYNPVGADLTAGQLVIRNAAIMRFLQKMIGGRPIYQPFDPTVADSPIILSYIPNTGYVGGDNHSTTMTPLYGLTEQQIEDLDKDPLMLYCTQTDYIAGDVLVSMYINLRINNGKNGLLNKLLKSNTTLAKWMNTHSEMLNYYYHTSPKLINIYTAATNNGTST